MCESVYVCRWKQKERLLPYFFSNQIIIMIVQTDEVVGLFTQMFVLLFFHTFVLFFLLFFAIPFGQCFFLVAISRFLLVTSANVYFEVHFSCWLCRIDLMTNKQHV